MKKVLVAAILFLIVYPLSAQEFTDLYGDYLGQTPPGDTPVVFAPGIISRNSLEHGPAVFSPDGNEVYWAWKDSPTAFMHIGCMKRINNRWTKPQAFTPFGDTVKCLDPFLSPDGRKLYFTAELKGIHEIWFVKKQGDAWSIPQSISPVINTTAYQGQPALNNSGTLYFLRDGISRSKFKSGEYLPPETLPSSINVTQYNMDPCIAPDDSYLLFASRRLNDQVDIYISFHDTLADTWSEPINLGEPINRNLPSYLGIDRFPAISPDGKYLFFSRFNGIENDCDVFWVSAKIITRLKEKVK